MLTTTLTPREAEILALMAEGQSNLEIGRRLYLSPRTVETHVANLLGKLDLPSTAAVNRRVLAVVAYLRAQAA